MRISPLRQRMIESPLGASSVNACMTALRFFVGITLGSARVATTAVIRR
jgi:hypothetical protein